MTPEVLNELHPHDPEAGFLTWDQAEDVLKYFGPADAERRHIHFFRGSGFESVHIFEATDKILAWGIDEPEKGMGCFESALRQAGWWPDRLMSPPPLRYVNVGNTVMRGAESICVARSNSSAKRIAAALNWYLPGRRGT